jgi:hypothetical protein
MRVQEGEKRPGNWVETREGEIKQVTAAELAGTFWAVPITKKRLKDLRFSKKGIGFRLYGLTFYEAKEEGDSAFCLHLGKIEVYVFYIHELQNLVFALTRKELALQLMQKL